MIRIKDKNLFWEFFNGIDKFQKPLNDNDSHYSLAKKIARTLEYAETIWSPKKVRILEPYKEGFIDLNRSEDTIVKHIREGNLKINTLNSIIIYFFSKLLAFENSKEQGVFVLKLEMFFKALDASDLDKNYFNYTEALLNYLISKVGLKNISFELNSNFRLIFYNKNETEEIIKPFRENEILLPNKTREKEDEYRLKLKEDFKEIRVGFADFSIPIEQVIELPFYRKDEEIDSKIESLKKSLQEFKDNNDLENTVRLSNRIKELKKLLNEPNSPNEILNRGEDIFILSPAGSGKTTTLKSFAYSLAFDQNRLPIFIELQSYKSDLNSLINEELKSRRLDLDSILKFNNENIVLLIDGFDEYSGENEAILINEIINFKRISGCQVVFTGRFKPKNIDKIKFYFYQLSEFSDEDINRVFRNVFPNNGQKYFDILLKEDLLRYVVTPLFLFFLITYLKQNDEEIELNSIRELLENKAKLLEKVLIDDFIYNYEQKKKINIPETPWIKIKTIQIQIISLFAYYLTFEQNNLENANFIDKKIIEYLISKIKHPFDIEVSFYTELFEDFKKHSILTIKGGNIGFDKKEVRLFFASNYLVSQIKNIDDYKKFKNDFKGDADSWNSIEKYVFGLIKPNKFMVDLKTFVVKDQIIYNNLFFQQLEYAQKFIYAGNFSQKFKLLDKFYFLNIIVMILFNHLKYGMNYSIEGFSRIKYQPYFLFRKLKKPYIEYFYFLIPRSNYYYHCYYPGKDVTIFHHLHELKEILELPQSKNVFEEIKVNESNFNRLNCSLNDSIISFSKIENYPNLIFSFVDYLIFDPNFRIKKDSKVDINYINDLKNLEHFLNQFFNLNAHSYLDYFFSTHNPTPLSLKTLYEYFQKNNIKIDSQKILALTKTTIINHFDVLAHHNSTKGIYKFTLLISRVLNNILVSEIKNELLDKWNKEIFNKKTEQKTKERLFIIYANHLTDKDISLFMSFLDDKNIEFQYNAVWGLVKYISSYLKKDEEIVNQINEKLHNLFNESDVNFKFRIIIIFKIFRVYPSQYFLCDIIEFANQNDTNEITYIEYFGNTYIKEAIPYLEKKLHKYGIISLIAFDALVKINAENHYKYNISFIEKSRISINHHLENLKQVISDRQLNEFDIDVINDSLLIGDITTFTIIKDLKEMTFLNPKDKKTLQDAYNNLFKKIDDLRRTTYYEENILNKKSPDN